jgi:Mg2+ and Co2+ transporter CorA
MDRRRTYLNHLSRRRSEYQDFEQKFTRFIQWFEHFLNNELNQRLDGLTLQASLDILKNEIRTIVADKRRHVSDLLIQARLLQSQSTDQIQLQIIKQKIEQLEQMMNTTEQHVEKRFDFPSWFIT